MLSKPVAVLALVVLMAAACTSDDSSTTTTTLPPLTVDAPTTSVDATTSVPSSTSTLAPLSGTEPPEYQIVGRSPTDGGGDEVVVLLDPGSYDSLSDIDLFDIIAEVVEFFRPVTILHIVDDRAAANVVADPNASEEARLVLTDHYLARLDDGFTITYLGPFASSGTAVLGS